MNKVSMDALNRGWSIGLGTVIVEYRGELEALAAAKLQTQARNAKPAIIGAGRLSDLWKLLQGRDLIGRTGCRDKNRLSPVSRWGMAAGGVTSRGR